MSSTWDLRTGGANGSRYRPLGAEECCLDPSVSSTPDLYGYFGIPMKVRPYADENHLLRSIKGPDMFDGHICSELEIFNRRVRVGYTASLTMDNCRRAAMC